MWLGLSLECAECHDHKHDPLSQKEYYQVFAYFNNVPHLGKAFGVHGPRLEVLKPGVREQIEKLERDVVELEQELRDEERSEAFRARLGRWIGTQESELARRSLQGRSHRTLARGSVSPTTSERKRAACAARAGSADR